MERKITDLVAGSAELNRLIDLSMNIVIVTHVRPDGDALGSSTGLSAYLKYCRDRNASVILPSPAGETLGFLAEGQEVIDYDSNKNTALGLIADADLIFCIDAGSFKRTEELEMPLRASQARKVLMDHHPDPETGCFDLVFSCTEISSASEVVYWVITAMGKLRNGTEALPSVTARALMCGMTTDTNNFANSVYPSTLRMASELLDAGVNRDEILEHVFNSYRENRLRIIGYLLEEKMVICGNGLSYIIFTKGEKERFDYREGDTEGIVNMPLAARNVRMSVMLSEDDGFFRVSIRSKIGVSAKLCARDSFNGGGHEQAAGGRLYEGKDYISVDELAAYIERNCARYL